MTPRRRRSGRGLALNLLFNPPPFSPPCSRPSPASSAPASLPSPLGSPRLAGPPSVLHFPRPPLASLRGRGRPDAARFARRPSEAAAPGEPCGSGGV